MGAGGAGVRARLGGRRDAGGVPRVGLLALLLAGFAGFALGACPDAPSGPRIVNFEPPDVSLGPREVRLDAASGAELARPHGAWHFARPAELASWDKDALFGLANDAGTCWGWVVVGAAADGDPRRYSQARLAEARTSRTRTDVDEYVLYVGHTAHRWELDGPLAAGVSGPEGTRVSTLVEGGRRYTLWARARGTVYQRRRACLDELTAAFGLRLL